MAALAVTPPTHAQTVQTPHVERYRLQNGLDVVLEESHRDAHVAVAMAYDIGSRDEPRGYEQLAHVVEHLTYRGSRHLAPFAALEQLERAGVEHMNGETGLDGTLYYSVVPSGALPLALWIESERLAFTLEAFTETSFARERDIVKNELRLRHGDRGRFLAHVTRALFGDGHPYTKSVWPARDLDDLTLSDAQWFFQHGYRPDNAHLVIVGDFAPAAVKTLVTRYFGPVRNPTGPAPVRPAPPAATARGAHLHFAYRGYVSSLLSVFRAPAPKAPEHVVVEVLAEVATGFLRHHLVGEQRVAVNVRGGIQDRPAGSELWFELMPAKGVDPPAAERALMAGLAALFESDLSSGLDEVKSELLRHELQSLEDPLRRARWHVASLASRDAPHDTTERLQALRAITPADLRRMAAYLTKPRLVADMTPARPDEDVGPAGQARVTP